jgi:NADH-quinone oxidoreductase subunit N
MVYSYIFIVCSLLSIIIGTLLALYTVKLKKLFAYSSIVHMGYMLLALGLSSQIGMAIAFYYFLIYLLSTINIFSIYLLMKSSNLTVFGNITDLSYLKNSNKLLALISVASLLSLAGIPPFMGFYGKLFVFNLLVSTGNYIICLILLLLSILSCVYYIRLVRFLYFDDRNDELIVYQKIQSVYLYIFVSILFFFNLVFLFFQEPLFLYITFLFN